MINNPRKLSVKLFALALAVILVLPFSLAVPKQAQAILASDICNPVQAMLDGVLNVINKILGLKEKIITDRVPVNDPKLQKQIKTKEECGDTIVSVAVNWAISTMTRSIINWANSGFEGKPAFVRDLKNNLKRSGDQALDQMLGEINIAGINGHALCGPFDQEIKNALRVSVAQQQRSTYQNQTRCSIDSILEKGGHTIKDFEQDFSKGGWPAWLNLTQSNNNRFGVYLNLRMALYNKQFQEVNILDKEVNLGNGFLSRKQKGKCLPGQTVDEYQILAEEKIAATDDPEERAKITQELNAIIATADIEGCIQREPDKIITPGQTISTGISKTLGIGTDRLLAADEINEMIGALLKGLMSKAFGELGLYGLSKNDETGKSYLDNIGEEDPSVPDPFSDQGGTEFPPDEEGAGENPYTCYADFGGQPATQGVYYSNPGPVSGVDDAPATVLDLPGVQANKYYKNIDINFDMKVNDIPSEFFMFFNIGENKNYFLTLGNGMTENANKIFYWALPAEGMPFYKDSPVAWTASTTFHVHNHYDSESNTLTIDVKNLDVVADGDADAGGLVRTDAFYSQSIVDGGNGFNIFFSGHADWVYSNIVVQMDPGGPFGPGLAAKPGSAGVTSCEGDTGGSGGGGGGGGNPPPAPCTLNGNSVTCLQ